ncbi:hypothetical protein GTO91_04095 [Heliobacterium undosum]|uniref:RelA/SpoT domain-containing protein n=1 Tax=Heliomicrobium undosum TaxID=121734 RepID=A0A845L2X1_9FIRM|nr:hypothetical protein [Heliomicrobium undosum]MZP28890.1 hypothetical protein [Heliomicrobium undosum]
MDFSNKIEIIEGITKVFQENCITELTNVQKDIISELKSILNRYDKQYELVYQNSVHEVAYYDFGARIKEDYSLFEKFIRKSIGLQVIEKYSLSNISDIEEKKQEIINYLLNFEDIIGVKIITELKKDCKSVYELIKEHKLELQDITFKDLEKQPKKMQNGLPIFNIKGVFREKYGFELQIKSKIESAWGDIDHGIFYKNYSHYPTKGTVQITMNHVGNLLDEIERLLLSLREANRNYHENAKKIIFMDKIHTTYGERFKQLLKVPYSFDKLISLLLYLYENTFKEFGNQEILTDDLDFSYLTFCDNSEPLTSFINLRNSSFDIMVLENIYLEWIKIKSNTQIIEKTYVDVINNFINSLFISYINVSLKKKHDVNLNELVIWLIKYVKSEEIFLDVDKYDIIVEYNSIITELMCRHADIIENRNYILAVVATNLFKGDLKTCTEHVTEACDIEFITFFNEMNKEIQRVNNKKNIKHILYNEVLTLNSDLISSLIDLGYGR